jgi:ATP adenylyltransferase
VIKNGTLWQRIESQARQAEASGALETIATERSVVENGGVRFVVRCVSSLGRKDRARQEPAPDNPFLPPDPALTLGRVAPAHVAVLNRFNVLANHLLVVTERFEDQESLLTLGDFEALCWALGEFTSLGFYNGGVEAGASQAHKHLQVVPLPLGEGEDLPLAVRLHLASAPFSRVCERNLPFSHALVRLPEGLAGRDMAATCHDLYRELLIYVGLAPLRSEPDLQTGPYNLLVTREFMLLVPRKREHFEDISLNALAFAGSLFVRTRAQVERVLEHGPLSVLRSVVA